MTVTPKQAGYRWPAEWEPHRCTWLSWPHNRDTWPGGFPEARAQYIDFAKTIARYEPVHLLAGEGEAFDSASDALGTVANVTVHSVPTNDAWIRDHGPVFLNHSRDQRQLALDWEYNAWGGKYPPFDLDNQIPARVARITGLESIRPGMVLEGGSVEGNGQGIILTTESCLLNPNRNPGRSRDQIEQMLRDYLCAEQVIWLVGDIPGDDTDGHIDQLARFVTDDRVLAVDDGGSMFAENRRRLAAVGKYAVEPLPCPQPKFKLGYRLPTSYANFYIVNGAVIVPAFDDSHDDHACRLLEDCFPSREIVPVPALDLVLGLGAFHCLSQQEPAAIHPPPL